MMRSIEKLFKGLEILEQHGSAKEVTSICFDSRKAEKGGLFVAVKGTTSDGHQFIPKVISAGVKVIVCEDIPLTKELGISYVKVSDSAYALGVIAGNYFENPSKELDLVGITGTNGKTTCVTLLHQLFLNLEISAGLISTVVNKLGKKEVPSTHTTPDPIQLNALLRQMVDEGCKYCFMEVSSHAVVQHRIAGLSFAGGAFTNITHEHLDYHKTFASYIKAKQAFFEVLPVTAFALSNADDKNGEVMLQSCKASKHYYALKTQADFKTRVLESNLMGLSLKMNEHEIWSPLVGWFNAYNLSTVYGVAMLLGLEDIEVLKSLSLVSKVPGRFQTIQLSGITGIVDYAHSPDALKNVLNTIKQIRTNNEQVITVVGCGGDRDRAKRPMMAEIACQYSNRIILTSDNPRTEDPQAIIEEMKTGVSPEMKAKVLSISDRKEAIRTASSLAMQGDILLVAGKGHEDYQEINGKRTHFDDAEELRLAITEIHSTPQ